VERPILGIGQVLGAIPIDLLLVSMLSKLIVRQSDASQTRYRSEISESSFFRFAYPCSEVLTSASGAHWSLPDIVWALSDIEQSMDNYLGDKFGKSVSINSRGRRGIVLTV
jgi:hypothetical protein